MEVNLINFWDLQYIWYILGFLFVPRLTMLFIFNNYVTAGFVWQNLFTAITIWWKYEILALGWLSKLSFSILLAFSPRLLLGIVGYIYLSPDNHIAMITFCVLGLIIDWRMKYAAVGTYRGGLRSLVQGIEKSEKKGKDKTEQSFSEEFITAILTKANVTNENGEIDNEYVIKLAKQLDKRISLFVIEKLAEEDLKVYLSMIEKRATPVELNQFFKAKIPNFVEQQNKLLDDYAHNFFVRTAKIRESLD